MADTAGLGGLNSVYVSLEASYGTYVDPSEGDGLWVPILTENLKYTSPNYYSPQIREEVIVSDAKESYLHVEGDITMEVDVTYLPLFLYASRHTVVETGVSTPFEYAVVPAKFGSAYPGGSAKGLSITVVRNGEGFGYSGCVVGQWVFTIDDGILKVTMSIQGLNEEEPGDLDATSWVDPELFGADSSSIYVADAATSPIFSSAANDFNGYTATLNYNADAQNRIRRDRQATFVKYGETEITYETELDFLTRDEYDKLKNVTKRALRLESLNSTDYAASSQAFRLDLNRTAYDVYDVETPGMGDLVMAKVTGRALGISGGNAFSMKVKSPTDLGFVV